MTAPLLADAAGVDDDALVRVMAALRENGFLFEARTGFETEYIFKHALIRDVALASIPRRRRKNLHRVIASSIESRYLSRLEPYLDQLAYHTRNAEMWEQAVSYAERAANRALDLSAYGLCVQHLDNALSSLERLPESSNRLEQAIDLRLALRAPLGAVGDIARMHARLDEAGNLLCSLNDENRAAAISISKTFAYNYTGELAKAKNAGVAALQLARSAANDEFIVAATYHLAQSYVWSGDYTEASELLAGVLGLATGALCESRIGTAGTMSVLILELLGAAEAYVGRFDDADKHIDEAIAIADQLSRPYDQTIARWYKGFALAQSGAHQKAIGLLEDAYHRCKSPRLLS